LRAGLITSHEGFYPSSGEWQVEVQPTPLLRSLFTVMPPLEEVYPLLVEFVMVWRYLDNPGFVDLEKTVQRLIGMGMTADGLMTLRIEIEYAEGRAGN
jgi:hypothetical protein